MWLTCIIIQLSYTVQIPVFWSADLYHVIQGCDETTSLMSLSWCNSHGVNSTQHCHYTMASADSKFDDFFCRVFKMLTHSLLVNYRDLPVLVH